MVGARTQGQDHLHTEVAIIGGGIAGLAAAHALHKRGIDYRLIESTDRWGGKIATERDPDGFVIERGADSVLDIKPHALDLIRELGLESDIVTSRDENRGAQLWQDDRLIPLPAGWQMLVPGRLAPFLVSPLLAWPSKLRVLGERWQPGGPAEGDESVAEFGLRRIGAEALRRLGEPILSHIHVGDIDLMSMASTYPSFAAIERRFGSLQAAASARPSPRGVRFSTLAGGLQSMVDALVAKLDQDALHHSRRAVSVTAGDSSIPRSRFHLRLGDGTVLATHQLVLATPASTAATLLDTISARPCCDHLRRLRCTSITTVTVTFRERDLPRPLRTFGAFVPRSANRRILACTWTSNKFAGRCPPGLVLIRAFVGGSEEHGLAGEAELVAIVSRELEEMIGVESEPAHTWISRFEHGYPQYDVDHARRLAAIEELAPAGVIFAGSPYHGVGIPDCIASGQRAAERVEQKTGSFDSSRG